MSKTTYIVIGVVVVLVALAWWLYGSPTSWAPGLGSESDSTSAINDELNSVDVGADVGSDFQAVDADLRNL